MVCRRFFLLGLLIVYWFQVVFKWMYNFMNFSTFFLLYNGSHSFFVIAYSICYDVLSISISTSILSNLKNGTNYLFLLYHYSKFTYLSFRISFLSFLFFCCLHLHCRPYNFYKIHFNKLAFASKSSNLF